MPGDFFIIKKTKYLHSMQQEILNITSYKVERSNLRKRVATRFLFYNGTSACTEYLTGKCRIVDAH